MKTFVELMGSGIVEKHQDVLNEHQDTIRQDREKTAAAAAHHTSGIVDKAKSVVKQAAGGGKYRKEGSDHILKFESGHEHKVKKELDKHFSKRMGGLGWHSEHHMISLRKNSEHGHHIHISPPTASDLMPRSGSGGSPSAPFKHGVMRRS